MINNPQAFMNGYTSMMRNMFLTSSIGLSTTTFSKKFMKYEKFMKFMAVIIFIYSMIIGLKATIDFRSYIDYMQQKKNISEPYNTLFKRWRGWTKIIYIYLIILIIISIVFIRQ